MTAGPDRLRVLCISPAFIPVPGSRAICAAKLVKALVEQGLEATVLYNDTLPREKGWPPETSACWDSIRSCGVVVAPPTGRRALRAAALAVRWGALGGFVHWVDAAIRQAMELHAQKPFDFVYSFSVPTWAHIAGYWVSKKTKLPWVMDVSDPWDTHQWPAGSQIPLPLWRRMHADFWERRCMARAALVTYPCERLAASTHRYISPPSSWIVLPHIGYAPPRSPAPDDAFHLVHTGTFSYGRSPRTLLSGLHRFVGRRPEARQRTKLTFVGPGDRAEFSRIAGTLDLLPLLTVVGEVSYETCLDYVGAAVVCLLVEANFSEGIFLPSKVVDYVAARKPLIALSPAVGTLNDLSVDPGIIRVNPDDVEGVASTLELLWQDFRDGTLDRRRPSQDLVATFEASSIAKRFLDALPRAGIVRRDG